MDQVAIQALDDDLTRRADIVFVAPAGIVQARSALNGNVHYSPHGVDFDLFSRASDPSLPVAEALSGVRSPIIGYFGSIGEWMDFELIAFLARSRPEWTFVFVGYASADTSAWRELPNILLPGPRPYEELPRWAKAFDVAIYPQKVNRQVKHSNPLKLREYLATGKPVVAVTTPETAKFSSVVRLADTPEDYLAAIERALAEDGPEQTRQRMDSVKPLSWDARFQETIERVAKMLEGKR
jgi:glycosyltransferase involved in cell wall biosynthesis